MRASDDQQEDTTVNGVDADVRQPEEAGASPIEGIAPADSASAGSPQAPVDLSKENEFLIDQLQRARAELDNFRRRTIEQRKQEERRQTIQVFRRILPFLDDLQLALKVEVDNPGQLEKGLRIIVDKFSKLLGEFEIQEIASVGEAFDPARHEAMFQVETSEFPAGHVMQEFEKGYLLGDHLVRPARVQVAKELSTGKEHDGAASPGAEKEESE